MPHGRKDTQVDGGRREKQDSPSGEKLMWKERDAWQEMSGW
jgi:hypothetical protein